MNVPGDADLGGVVADRPANIDPRQYHLRAVVQRAKPQLIGHAAIERDQRLVALYLVEGVRPDAMQSIDFSVDEAAAVVAHPSELRLRCLIRGEREVLRENAPRPGVRAGEAVAKL